MTPPPIRLAATILLVRDGPEGAEISMVVRNRKMDFASGALVFPGGSVDEGDRSASAYCDGDDAEGEALALRVAAIREAFEECGVLLARRDGALVDGAEARRLAPWRAKMEAREASISDLAAAEGLTLAVDLIRAFAHWITPAVEPKRFDTHFLIAEAPAGHELAHDGGEAVDSVWLTPAAALAEGRAGTKALLFPTWLNLGRLEGARTAAEALEMAAEATIVPVMPDVTREDGKIVLRIPAEAGYPASAYAIAGFAAEPEPLPA